MEVEQMDNSCSPLANGSANSGKRRRGRPRGSFKKTIVTVKEVSYNARASKRVDFFAPETTMIRPKVKKRGRPKKIKIPGRPRKIPLTPEEEAERILRLNKKRKLSKPLGRPRIHPLVDMPKEKRGRGRPRKYESMGSQNSSVDGNLKKSLKIVEVVGDARRSRGRPRGSFKKKRGRPAGPSLLPRPLDGTPGRRGRPPGSGTKLQVKQDTNETPRKRGRPPGSRNKLKVISGEVNGTPRKRGRPPGSGMKVMVATQVMDGIPRKRGRPPGSGSKVKVLLQETNRNPRKRGRPLGSRNVKTVTKNAGHPVLMNSAFSVDGQPRKRGRPKKIEAFLAIKTEEEKSLEPSPKRPRNMFTLVKNSGKSGAEDQKASESDGYRVAATLENPVASAGAAKPDNIEQVNDAFPEELHEVISKKSSTLRVAGKSQKKK